MPPVKVRVAVRRLLRDRVERLVRQLTMPSDLLPDSLIAESARLVGEAGWLLDPEAAASALIVQCETEACRYARVCVWDGECEADATTDDGLCAAHAAEQAREDAEIRAQIARGEVTGGETSDS